jgi:hypothetical protein
MSYIKEQNLHTRKFKDRQFLIKADGSIELTPSSGTVTINGDLNVTGSSSGPTNSLTYYVSKEGSDLNDGLASGPDRAKASVKSAVEAAPIGATIQIAPGDYYENNPITLKARQTVRGDSLRNTQLWPLNNTSDFFFVDNACYIFQVTFRGLADPGWCVRIRPGALVTTSPYVQNSSNINGPWLNDGTEFVPFETVQIEGIVPTSRPIINNENVPLGKRVNEIGGGNGMLVDGNDYDQRSLVFSMVADAFTQIAQGGIGFHITNFGYTQIVSCFSVFTRIGFLATNGGYLSISNSVSDFGTYALVADGVFDKVYTTARPVQDYYSNVGSVTIGSQGAGYTGVPAVIFESPTSPGGVTATGTASIDAATGKVTSVAIDNPGSGYDFVPSLTFVGGGYSVIATGIVNLVTNRIIDVNSLRDLPQVGSVISFDGDPIKYYVTETSVATQPFTYNETTCRRDVQRIIDAVMGDVVLGTNYQSIAAGKSYLRSTSAIVLQQQLAPTIYGIEAIRDEILIRIGDEDSTSIIEKFALITNILEEGDSAGVPDIDYNELSGIDAGVINAKDNIIANKEFIIEEITNYIAEQFTDLSYDQDKCERDVRLICQAVAYDVALGTNYNAVTAGLSYKRANAVDVTEKQLTQTLAAFAYLKTQILALSNVIASPTATSRATAAMDEIIDIVSGVNFNEAVCSRDLGYIIDATAYDIALGTNYNSVTAGISYQRAPSAYVLSAQFQKTIASIEYLKTLAATDYLSADATAVSRSNAAFNEIVDIVTNNTPDALTWSDPGVDANKAYARILLQANRAFIATELTGWINTTYPSLDYNEVTCARDVGYIVDALSHDVQYGTNFATRKVADAYFSYAVSILPAAQRIETAAAYAQLATIVADIVEETYAGQTTTGNPASGTEATEVDGLVQIIEDVITANSLSGLPALSSPSTSWVDNDILTARNNFYNSKLAIIENVLNEININLSNADTLTWTNPTGGITEKANAKDQLIANREFLQAEVIAWIAINYPSLSYNVDKCNRDVGYIVDSLTYDILYGGNTAIRNSASSYFVGTASQLGTNEATATVNAYERLQAAVSSVVQGVTFLKSSGNALTQDTSSGNATGVEGLRVDSLINEIIVVIEDGNLDNLVAEVLPSVVWASSDLQNANASIYAARNNFATSVTAYLLATYPTFTYDRTKCQRDVGLIVDAVVRDIKIGTNFNGIQAGQAYRRGSARVVDADQLPATIIALRYLKTLILADLTTPGREFALTRATESLDAFLQVVEYGTLPSEGITYPSINSASQALIDSARQLQDNRTFLIEETIAWIADNYFVYDATKCARDTQIILDSVGLDLVLGTNYNSVTAGIAYYRAASSYVISDQITQTIAAITHLKSAVSTLITADANSVTRTNAAFDEILDIIQNGIGNADALTWSDPGVNSNKRFAREQLQTNKVYIGTELTDWIDAQIIANAATPSSIWYSFTYNAVTCRRDVGYIVDGLSHDVQYGTNYGTRIAATSYFVSAVQVLPAAQRPATAAAMAQLANIVSSIVQETYAGQDVTGTAATGTEGTEVSNLVGYVEDVITAGELDSLPALSEPSTAWVAAGYVTSRNLIRSSGDSTDADLVQDLIDYINTSLNGLDYNEINCRRDTGYLIDSATHDLLYGGNRASLICARAYFDAGVLQVSDYTETSAALVHLRDVSEDVIEGVSVTPTTGNNESQSLVSGFGTATQSASATTLYNITINALDAGSLLGTPANLDPSYTLFVATATLEAADVVLNSSITKQTQVINYITDNILGLTYNIEKCQRDTSYIIDAAIYDMMYGGNKQTRRAGEAYYNGAILGSATYGTVNQTEVTEFTYKRLAKVLSDVAQNIEISTSEGNILTQTIGLGLSDGSSAAGSYIYTMVEKIAEVVKTGTTAIPTEVDHSYDVLGDGDLNIKRNAILAVKQEIEDNAIAALNLEFGGVATLTLFPGVLSVLEGTLSNMQNVSTISTAGHSFEYVGAGITYNALPFFGGSPIVENQVVETNIGKVFSTSSDQIGNFAVGQFFNVNALTGAITLNANQLNLSGLSAIGPFQRDGIPVGVVLREVSNSTNLVASTGISESDTAPTQNAVVQYVENRYLNKITGGTVQGDTQFDTNITVNGGNIETINTTFNLINDNASTVNFAGGATEINIGASIGTTTFNNDVVIDGTVNINGDTVIIGDISMVIPDEAPQAFSITEGTEDYISIDTRVGLEQITFGEQPRIEINNSTQAETDTTNTGALVVAGGASVGRNLSIGGDLYFEGEIISGNAGNISLFNNAAGVIEAFGAATEITIGSSGIVPGTFEVKNDYIRFSSVYNLAIPTGNVGERGTSIAGSMRFNTTIGQFEGYDGSNWNSLGGVRDVDGNTFILPESAPGANENELMFYTNAVERMNLSTSALTVDSTITSIIFSGVTQSTSKDTGNLVVEGGVGIERDVFIGGSITAGVNATIDGNLIANGDVTLGTIEDSTVNTLTVNANSVFNLLDNTVQSFELIESANGGGGGNSYFKVSTTNGDEKISIQTPIVKIDNTTQSTNSSNGALVVAGGVGISGNLFVDGGFTVGGSIAFGNDVDVDTFTVIGDTDFTIPDNNSEAFRIDQGTNNYFNIATTDGSELVSFGTTPKVFIGNTTDASSKDAAALVVNGGVGIELNTYIGVDLFVGRNTVLTGDLAVNGADLTTTATTFNLVNTNATTVNFAGAATAINIGAATGIITINNEQVIFNSVKSIQIPVGGNADRPSAITGQIRFNSDALVFEGYDGIAWGSLGGVKDVDQNTFIRPETSPGANNNELEFYTDGVKRMGLGTSELIIDSTINTTFEATTTSTSDVTGALVIAGGVGIAENLYVGGRIGGDIQIGEDITSILTIIGETILAPDSLRIISNAPDSAADDIVYPVTFAHHSISGTPTAGSGTGVKFELETSNDNFETGGKIDVVVQDVTGTQEDFDMVFSTMISGSVAEKFRIGELTATFEDNVAIKGGSLTTDQTTFNLLNTTATTVNFASDGTIISIGSISGTTTVNHNLHVTGTISTDVDLEVQYGGTGVSTFTTDGILYGNAADPLQVTDAAGTSDTSVSFQILTVTSDVDATPVWTDTIDGGSF